MSLEYLPQNIKQMQFDPEKRINPPIYQKTRQANKISDLLYVSRKSKLCKYMIISIHFEPTPNNR